MKRLTNWYDNLFITRDDCTKVPTWFELALLCILIIGIAIGLIYLVFFKEYTL